MRTVRLSVIGLVWSVLLFGFSGGTFVPYVIQLLPIFVALRLMSRAPGHLGAYAAVPLCVWWFVKMVLIWLFLLGVSTAAAGGYTPAEIAFSVVVAFFAGAGIVRGVQVGRPLALSREMMTLLVFGALQATTMAVPLLLSHS